MLLLNQQPLQQQQQQRLLFLYLYLECNEEGTLSGKGKSENSNDVMSGNSQSVYKYNWSQMNIWISMENILAYGDGIPEL